MSFFKHRQSFSSSRVASVEGLEARRLLADVIVSINYKAGASETDPTGSGLGQFTVRRTGDTSQFLDVSVRFSPGASTATAGVDVLTPPKVVRIHAGRSYAHFNITPIDDNIVDPDETVVMKLWPGAGYEINPARPKSRFRITDNDTSVGIFAVKNASENDPTGTGRGQFKITRNGQLNEPLEVSYYIRANSMAKSGEDFEPLPGKVTIPAGQRSVFFDVIPIDDDVVEVDETLVLAIRDNPAYTRDHAIATVTIQDNDVSIEGWWNDDWEFRAPITISAAAHDRFEHPVDTAINFTQILSNLGRSGSLIEDSIRVVETTEDGLGVINEFVQFQFDKDPDFDASTNASGNLVIIMSGPTLANFSRHYHVYFDTEGSFEPAEIFPEIFTTDNVMDEGQTSVSIETAIGTYFYQKQGGGLSSFVDSSGNDWINYNTTAGSAGNLRGVPNLPGSFHPGNTDSATQIVSQGPLKTVLESSSQGGARRIRWEFYPTFARATVLAYNTNYWFLYVGTPGGAVDSEDFVVRSDGTQTGIDVAWDDADGLGSGNDQEWVYFADGTADRFLWLAHDQTDNLEDSYFNLDGNMTVFGFGRHNNSGSEPQALMTTTPQSFTIGLGFGGDNFDAAASIINRAYQAVSTVLGAGQTRLGG